MPFSFFTNLLRHVWCHSCNTLHPCVCAPACWMCRLTCRTSRKSSSGSTTRPSTSGLRAKSAATTAVCFKLSSSNNSHVPTTMVCSRLHLWMISILPSLNSFVRVSPVVLRQVCTFRVLPAGMYLTSTDLVWACKPFSLVLLSHYILWFPPGGKKVYGPYLFIG